MQMASQSGHTRHMPPMQYEYPNYNASQIMWQRQTDQSDISRHADGGRMMARMPWGGMGGCNSDNVLLQSNNSQPSFSGSVDQMHCSWSQFSSRAYPWSVHPPQYYNCPTLYGPYQSRLPPLTPMPGLSHQYTLNGVDDTPRDLFTVAPHLASFSESALNQSNYQASSLTLPSYAVAAAQPYNATTVPVMFCPQLFGGSTMQTSSNTNYGFPSYGCDRGYGCEQFPQPSSSTQAADGYWYNGSETPGIYNQNGSALSSTENTNTRPLGNWYPSPRLPPVHDGNDEAWFQREKALHDGNFQPGCAITLHPPQKNYLRCWGSTESGEPRTSFQNAASKRKESKSRWDVSERVLVTCKSNNSGQDDEYQKRKHSSLSSEDLPQCTSPAATVHHVPTADGKQGNEDRAADSFRNLGSRRNNSHLKLKSLCMKLLDISRKSSYAKDNSLDTDKKKLENLFSLLAFWSKEVDCLGLKTLTARSEHFSKKLLCLREVLKLLLDQKRKNQRRRDCAAEISVKSDLISNRHQVDVEISAPKTSGNHNSCGNSTVTMKEATDRNGSTEEKKILQAVQCGRCPTLLKMLKEENDRSIWTSKAAISSNEIPNHLISRPDTSSSPKYASVQNCTCPSSRNLTCQSKNPGQLAEGFRTLQNPDCSLGSRKDEPRNHVCHVITTDANVMRQMYSKTQTQNSDSASNHQPVAGFTTDSLAYLVEHKESISAAVTTKQDLLVDKVEFSEDVYTTCLACKKMFSSSSLLEDHLLEHIQFQMDDCDANEGEDESFDDNNMDREYPAWLRVVKTDTQPRQTSLSPSVKEKSMGSCLFQTPVAVTPREHTDTTLEPVPQSNCSVEKSAVSETAFFTKSESGVNFVNTKNEVFSSDWHVMIKESDAAKSSPKMITLNSSHREKGYVPQKQEPSQKHGSKFEGISVDISKGFAATTNGQESCCSDSNHGITCLDSANICHVSDRKGQSKTMNITTFNFNCQKLNQSTWNHSEEKQDTDSSRTAPISCQQTSGSEMRSAADDTTVGSEENSSSSCPCSLSTKNLQTESADQCIKNSELSNTSSKKKFGMTNKVKNIKRSHQDDTPETSHVSVTKKKTNVESTNSLRSKLYTYTCNKKDCSHNTLKKSSAGLAKQLYQQKSSTSTLGEKSGLTAGSLSVGKQISSTVRMNCAEPPVLKANNSEIFCPAKQQEMPLTADAHCLGLKKSDTSKRPCSDVSRKSTSQGTSPNGRKTMVKKPNNYKTSLMQSDASSLGHNHQKRNPQVCQYPEADSKLCSTKAIKGGTVQSQSSTIAIPVEKRKRSDPHVLESKSQKERNFKWSSGVSEKEAKSGTLSCGTGGQKDRKYSKSCSQQPVVPSHLKHGSDKKSKRHPGSSDTQQLRNKAHVMTDDKKQVVKLQVHNVGVVNDSRAVQDSDCKSQRRTVATTVKTCKTTQGVSKRWQSASDRYSREAAVGKWSIAESRWTEQGSRNSALDDIGVEKSKYDFAYITTTLNSFDSKNSTQSGTSLQFKSKRCAREMNGPTLQDTISKTGEKGKKVKKAGSKRILPLENSISDTLGKPTSAEVEVGDNVDLFFCSKCMTVFTKRQGFDQHGCQKTAYSMSAEDTEESDLEPCPFDILEEPLIVATNRKDEASSRLHEVIQVDSSSGISEGHDCHSENCGCDRSSKTVSKAETIPSVKGKKEKQNTTVSRSKKVRRRKKKPSKSSLMFRCDQCHQTYCSRGGLLFHRKSVHKAL